jgi:hypothetical protein
MAFYPNGARGTLSDADRRMLFEKSGIDPAVAAERGYYTARRRSEVPEVFKEYQRKPGLVVPMFSPDGETTGYQLRPNHPIKRKNGSAPKYETPAGSHITLDVNPLMLDQVRHGDGDLWVTEGCKKVDSLASWGEPAVGFIGVWNMATPKTKGTVPLACWQHVRLKGRRVIIVFDADARTNPDVQEALRRAVKMLEGLGAIVLVVYLPEVNGDGKAGVDDYLAADGTVAELRIMAGTYEPVDVGAERMSRDDKLRAIYEDLERRYWHFGREHGCKNDGGETAQDVFLQLIEDARRSGKVHRDGIRVQKAHGPLALEVGISSRTLVKCIRRLEEWGVLYRDNETRKSRQAGHFVLRADVKHKGGTTSSGEAASKVDNPCTLQPRSPRLMWSRAKWKPTKKMVRDHRLGKLSILPEPREGVSRLGKRRGHIFDALDCAGGELTLQELGERTGRRPRDLVRRKRTEKGRDGLLIWPIAAGIVRVEGDVVSLTPDWLQRIEIEREVGEEIEMSEIARRRYERKKRDYHEQGGPEAIETESPPPLMGRERVERIMEERSNEDLAARIERQREKVGNTAETFVFDRLKELPRIRLGLLREVYADTGGDPEDVLPAAVRLGYRIERLTEYGNERFVFPPLEGVA